MKPDLYTKTVLTVIAAALLWICAQNAGSPRAVFAQKPEAPQRILIVDQHGNPLSAGDSALPVRIVSPLPK